MIYSKHYPCLEPQQTTPTLVIMHGLFGNSDNWHSIAQSLSSHFDIYTLDLPNHGRSSRIRPASYDSMANLIKEWMQEKAIKRCFLLGHSMGGKVAMQFASQFADVLQGLLVADIAPVDYQSSHHDIFAGLQAIPPNITSRKLADTILQDYESTIGVRQFLLKNLVKSDNGYQWQIDIDNLLTSYDTIRAKPPLLNPFSGPTLFIKGEHSSYIQNKDKDAILSWFPNAEVKVIPATGHWLHAEKPLPFASLVRRFCQRHLPKTKC
ncbi:alpha/beta fold hydrolase [Marinomonas agarivorans]|nr:alpha/beta fold hydrolase [Marinomonas agarivorans]